MEERVDVSRRATISNGQSLFDEINTLVRCSIDAGSFISRIRARLQDSISNECVSQCLDSSNIETIDDMEVQILLSKTDSFNSIHLKDVVKHVNGHCRRHQSPSPSSMSCTQME